MSSNGRRDARILPPPARSSSSVRTLQQEITAKGLEPPTAPELVQLLEAENTQLRSDAQMAKVAAGSMANLALALAQIMADHGLLREGQDTIRVPRWVYQKIDGRTITVSPSGVTGEGDVIVRITERADSPKLEES